MVTPPPPFDETLNFIVCIACMLSPCLQWVDKPFLCNFFQTFVFCSMCFLPHIHLLYSVWLKMVGSSSTFTIATVTVLIWLRLGSTELPSTTCKKKLYDVRCSKSNVALCVCVQRGETRKDYNNTSEMV